MEPTDERTGRSRRDFLKKSAAIGAVAWTTPVVATLPGGRAWAQTYQPPCVCTASAFGLRVVIPALGFDQIYDTGAADPAVATVDTGSLSLGALGTIRVRATAVSANDGVPPAGGCHGEASITALTISGTAIPLAIRPIRAAVLGSETHANCDACDTGGGSAVGGLVVGPTTILVGACNLDVAGLMVVDEQFCVDGVRTNNALHVNIPGVIEVIAAHTEAGATGCPCTAC